MYFSLLENIDFTDGISLENFVFSSLFTFFRQGLWPSLALNAL